MLQAFIITLREGVEAALIVGITLVYLGKLGRPDLRRIVYSALGAAFVASVVLGVIVARLELNQEMVEGWLLLAAAFFVIMVIYFMARAARTLRAEIEGAVQRFADRRSLLGLFAFVFLMVLREGTETVLILSAISFNTSELMALLGTLLGIGTAIVFGVMFVKGSVRIDLRRFFRITTVILVFVAVQLIISGLHELSESGVLPSSKEAMALIGPIVRNDAFFFVTILALAAMMVLFEYRRRPSPQPAAASRAQERKAEWTARRERLWMASVYVSSFVFILLITAQFIYAKSTATLSPATRLEPENGVVTVALDAIREGELHRFAVRVEGKEVRFLVTRKPDETAVALFDACEICGDVGYYRSPEGLVCLNCAAPIAPQSLGQSGGCNPIPLASTADGSALRIAMTDLAAGAPHFH
jgi:FTR1 family protein